MKTGTVLRNDYVADDSPLKYVIYVGSDGEYLHTAYPYHGKIERGKYYKHDVGKGKEIYPVGCTDVLKRMVSLLQEDLAEFRDLKSED